MAVVAVPSLSNCRAVIGCIACTDDVPVAAAVAEVSPVAVMPGLGVPGGAVAAPANAPPAVAMPVIGVPGPIVSADRHGLAAPLAN